ncbi:MAG: trimethylamine methyltransferase family protein [Hyphomicrobiaceae bacterium]
MALGAGHFLGTEQTIALMESEFCYPEVAEHSAYGVWETNGSPGIRDTERARAREILPSHYPQYLPPRIEEEIRRRFPIVLDLADMTVECRRW